MSKIFISIYFWFKKHRLAFWLSMLASLFVFAYMASGIRLEENVTAFFPKGKGTKNMAEVFSNMRMSDKIVVMFTPGSEMTGCSEDSLFCASDSLEAILERHGSLIKDYAGKVSENEISSMISFLNEHLPVFMDDSDFDRLELLDDPECVDSLIHNAYLTLISPTGFATKDFIMSDPLGIGSGVMARTQYLNPASDYIIKDGHIFTPDGNTMLAFIEPAFAAGETGHNDKLVSCIEDGLRLLSEYFPTVVTHYFGGPAVGVYNARQIKKDTYATAIVALIIIIFFILAVFKRRRSVFLILCPVVYGAVFALAMASLFQDSISGIAVGAGAAIMGIALSYSIHMLAHQNHVKDVPQLLDEICSPLVIGSITTIGAFLGLLCTSSQLLGDFGLFASLTLVGTMSYCLLFLPQFLIGSEDLREGRVLSFIGEFSAYPFEKNKWLAVILLILTVICAYTSTKVGFNSDMMSINYWEPHLKEAEDILTAQTDKDVKMVMFISTGSDGNAAYDNYRATAGMLDSLRKTGLIRGYDGAGAFIKGKAEQTERISRWTRWWTPERLDALRTNLQNAAVRNGFVDNAFDSYIDRLSAECRPVDYFEMENMPAALSSWVIESDELKMLVSQVVIPKDNLTEVYDVFLDNPDVVIFDRAYFANGAAESINNDFYLILYISSFLIFFVLWLSYGRFELALLSFLPMFVSWVIIIGIMGMIGMEFNIVNIILSTFIFGMGDDFSIFILEGLLHKYKTGKQLLDSHKTAIFFSSFTMIVGIGVLVFAKHPALHSMAVITILGMIAVVLVAYILEPLIFNAFVTGPTSNGRPPYTFWSLFRDIYYYVPVFIGGTILLVCSLILSLLPIGRSRRQALVAGGMHYCCKLLLRIMPFIKSRRLGPDSRPVGKWTGEAGVIVANHQSSLDIFVIAAMFPKIKFMVADWVMKSPLFAAIAGFLGYYAKSEGYENSYKRIAEDIADGWSVVIFPEGTRSADGRIRRFHKGAFYLACNEKVPVIPVVMYGNRRILPKNDGFNMMEGLSEARILSPIHTENAEYHELTKRMESLIKQKYEALCMEFDSPKNPYFKRALESGYIYKGPVTEWYVKIKTALESGYAEYDSLLPRSGRFTDLGCGMGQLAYMLSMYSPERKILGIDYDASKIAIAENCWMHHNLPGLQFRTEDVSDAELPESDAFIISDMLHYLPENKQFALLEKCRGHLTDGGRILIRDGNPDYVKGHKITAFTELLSTRILRFNKTAGTLHFCSEAMIRDYAARLGMTFTCVEKGVRTSNTLYMLDLK